jgi:hypothetical protein
MTLRADTKTTAVPLGVIDVMNHSTTKSIALTVNEYGMTRPGPSADMIRDATSTEAIDTTAEPTKTAGSAVTGNVERNKASRAALPPVWKAIIAPADKTAASNAESASVRRDIRLDIGLEWALRRRPGFFRHVGLPPFLGPFRRPGVRYAILRQRPDDFTRT